MVLAGVPGRSAMVALRTVRRTIAPPTCSLEAIELTSGRVESLRCPSSSGHVPAAFAVLGTSLLVAPGSPPRWPAEPAVWGPEITDVIGN